jgi:hypothetical protein
VDASEPCSQLRSSPTRYRRGRRGRAERVVNWIFLEKYPYNILRIYHIYRPTRKMYQVPRTLAYKHGLQVNLVGSKSALDTEHEIVVTQNCHGLEPRQFYLTFLYTGQVVTTFDAHHDDGGGAQGPLAPLARVDT